MMIIGCLEGGISMSGFLKRYHQGEYQQVWDELDALGAGVREDAVHPEATAVARETMQRVRHNIEVVIPRLEVLGYQFGYAWVQQRPSMDDAWVGEQPERFIPPSQETPQRLKRFEELVGAIPLSVRAFWSEVGAVNLVGEHSRWEELFQRYTPRELEPPNLDPLFVEGLSKHLLDLYIHEHAQGEALFPLPLAPDAYHKYNISGSGGYEIALPDASADAPLLNEWHHTTFVNYLRVCLHYGGLPGLQRISNLIPDELAYICEEFLPF
jgi:hypothetical protein